jgi:hypothetical protein
MPESRRDPTTDPRRVLGTDITGEHDNPWGQWLGIWAYVHECDL